MNKISKHHLLVLTNIKSRHQSDVRNVFVIDYIKSVAKHLNIDVLSTSLIGKKEITISKLFDDQVYTHIGITPKATPFFKPLLYLIWLFRSYTTAKKNFKDVTIIHCHATIIHGTLALLLSKHFKSKLVFTEHTGPFTSITNSIFKKFWAKFLMQKADAVLCVSNHLRHEILKADISPKKIITTYNPVDTDLFYPNHQEQSTSKTFLFAGRLDEQKGASRVLDAFLTIQHKYPDWQLNIIGDGREMPLLQTLKQKSILPDKINILGAKTKAEIASQMKSSTVFISASEHESFGLVIAEAMAAGLPVIAGNNSAPKEYVNNNFGVLVNVNSKQDIADAMDFMINNHHNYNPIKTREYIIERFGFDTFGKRLTEVYNNL